MASPVKKRQGSVESPAILIRDETGITELVHPEPIMPSRDSFCHYLPVDDVVVQLGSYLTGAGRVVISPGQPYPPGEHPSLYDLEWKRGRTSGHALAETILSTTAAL
jgi:hypothetical protein